jgi:glycosyltransferase involved in cell wall biosynthesis
VSKTRKVPAVAVVIPVYCSSEQHEIYLTEALESVARQTFRDFEVIVVDDASPRNIAPILARVHGLPGLQVIRGDSNIGHARSRNAGLQATEAEFVAFLDHDDLWAPEKLARQVQELENAPEAGMVFCRVKLFGSHAHRLPFDQSIIPRRPSFLWLFYHGNYVITASAVLVRRDALLDIGLFDPRYTTSDDFDAWLKIIRQRPIIYMPEELASYRLHALNVNYQVDRLNDTRLLLSLYIRYWLSAPIPEKLRLLPRLARKLLGRPYYYIFRRQRFRD